MVFVTRYRHEVFADRHLARMEEVLRAACEDFEVELVEFDGEANHVHLLVNLVLLDRSVGMGVRRSRSA